MKDRGFLTLSNIKLPCLYYSVGYFYDFGLSSVVKSCIFMFPSLTKKNPCLSRGILHEAVLSNMSWQGGCEKEDANTFLHIKNINCFFKRGIFRTSFHNVEVLECI